MSTAKDALYDAISAELSPFGVGPARISSMTNRLEQALAEQGYYIAPIQPATDHPTACRTDPRTSNGEITYSMRAGSQRHRLLEAYAEWYSLTDEEAMERAEGVSPLSEYATRCSEMRNAGWIEDTGEDRKGGSGTPRIVCRITDAGRAQLRKVRS